MRTEFIMDVGSNHNQDMERISRLIEAAKNIGCMAVKFQLFNEDLYAPECKKMRTEITRIKLYPKWVPEMALICKGLDIQFHCTPFSIGAVFALAPYVDEFKIGSYEILWTELISQCLATGKPVSVALGNVSNYEIGNMNSGIAGKLQDVYICDSHYPASVDSVCLADFRNLLLHDILGKRNYSYSDHTRNPGIIYRAAALGAARIEFHGDLDDKAGAEYHHGHVWTVSEMGEIIKNVRIGEAAEQRFMPYELDPAISKWRTDPTDGHRPLKEFREELSQ